MKLANKTCDFIVSQDSKFMTYILQEFHGPFANSCGGLRVIEYVILYFDLCVRTLILCV
jgi:hypothetical protein